MSAATATKGKEDAKSAGASRGRAYVRQADVPKYPLREVLRVAAAIGEQYAKQPTKPIDVALALDLSPKHKKFEYLTGASIAYGLHRGWCAGPSDRAHGPRAPDRGADV